MKNFVQKGENLTLKAPKDLRSGDVAVIGSIIGIVEVDALKGEDVVVCVTGVYHLPKVAELIEQGTKIYFKDGVGVTKVAADAQYIGVCVQDAAASEPDVLVRLNGSF